MNTNSKKIVVIGGGAAGIFAAINTLRLNKNASCTVYESTSRLLTKVLISGGGRCNITHNCYDSQLFAKNYPRGHKQLLSAFSKFQAKDTLNWFHKEGVETSAEKDGRIFPKSNKSKTISETLLSAADRAGVVIKKNLKVQEINKVSGKFILTLKDSTEVIADKILIATGSNPKGYEFCQRLGHKIIPPVPSLFTFKIQDDFIKDLAGQSSEDVTVELNFPPNIDKKTYRQKGPLLITHWGISGPAVLKLSAFAAIALFNSNYKAQVKINWLGERKYNSILNQLIEFREKNKDKKITVPPDLNISKRLWSRFVQSFDLLTWQHLTKKNINQIVQQLCQQKLTVCGKGIFKEEFVTCGGVDLEEVNFKKMESKIVSNLFFAGEVLNIDGITGGFNFQNAWTTSWIASQHMAE